MRQAVLKVSPNDALYPPCERGPFTSPISCVRTETQELKQLPSSQSLWPLYTAHCSILPFSAVHEGLLLGAGRGLWGIWGSFTFFCVFCLYFPGQLGTFSSYLALSLDGEISGCKMEEWGGAPIGERSPVDVSMTVPEALGLVALFLTQHHSPIFHKQWRRSFHVTCAKHVTQHTVNPACCSCIPLFILHA